MRTTPMSTIDGNAELGVTQAPGSSIRLATKPFTGDEITVFDRLIFSSSGRASACECRAFARSRLCRRRLVRASDIVVGLLLE